MLKRLLVFIIFSSLFQMSWAYQVNGGKVIDDSGQEIQLRGVNLFGFETENHVVHGLWSRNWKEMIAQIKATGFNAVRLPFCPQTLKGAPVSSIDYGKNSDLSGLDSLEIFDAVISELDRQAIYVLLDHHRPDCQAISQLWYHGNYSEQDWIDDLVFIANRYQNVPHVVGIDLKNEPHGAATWGTGNVQTDWNTAAEKAGNAVLAANPNLLIFVEGIQESSVCSGMVNHWWGGNLEPINCYPLDIPANKLVLSPHVYGPDVYEQTYFDATDFPNNMPAIWDAHFGNLIDQGYTIIPGEFGGRYGHGGNAKDKIWQDALVDYFIAKGIKNYFYWSWNPNSGDTGGILQDDWNNIWQDKVDLLMRLSDQNISDDNTDNKPDDDTGDNTDIDDETGDTENNNDDTSDDISDNNNCWANVEMTIVDSWDTGINANISITNLSQNTLSSWNLTAEFAANIKQIWNAKIISKQGQQYSFSNTDWNGQIVSLQKIEFGFLAEASEIPKLENLKLNGVSACSGSENPDSEEHDSEEHDSEEHDSEEHDLESDDVIEDENDIVDDGVNENTDDESESDDQTDEGQGDNKVCAADVEVNVINQWNTGYEASVKLINLGQEPFDGWDISFDYEPQIGDVWNVDMIQLGSRYTLTSKNWNGVLDNDESYSFGFIGVWTGGDVPDVTNVRVNGNPICQ